jgi:hypothetical protein
LVVCCAWLPERVQRSTIAVGLPRKVLQARVIRCLCPAVATYIAHPAHQPLPPTPAPSAPLSFCCSYAGDDINKVFWMWRISGGVFPEVPREAEFLSPRDGQLRVDRDASPTFAKSLMYRLSYHRFGEVYTDMRTPPGFDRVRNQGTLDYLPSRLLRWLCDRRTATVSGQSLIG